MKYSLQCKYSMINQMFLFVIKSMQKDVDYSFEWRITNIDKPIWILTNNDIVFKAENINDLVYFSVYSSKQDLKQQQIKTARVPILSFETDKQNLEITYDFSKQPNKVDIIVAKILSKVIDSYGGGFLETQQEYQNLQKQICEVLINNGLVEQSQLQQTVKTEKKTRKKRSKKETTKTVQPKDQNVEKETVKEQNKEEGK